MTLAQEIELLGGERAYRQFTEENFEDKKMLSKVKNYPKENYFFWGDVGTGKTHLGIAIGRKLLPNFKLVRVQDISRKIRGAFDEREEKEFINMFADTNCLIDDLGSEKYTEFLLSVMYEIIDKKWQNMSGGWIITSNHDIPTISKILGDRVTSRLVDIVGSNIIHFSGSDRRIK